MQGLIPSQLPWYPFLFQTMKKWYGSPKDRCISTSESSTFLWTISVRTLRNLGEEGKTLNTKPDVLEKPFYCSFYLWLCMYFPPGHFDPGVFLLHVIWLHVLHVLLSWKGLKRGHGSPGRYCTLANLGHQVAEQWPVSHIKYHKIKVIKYPGRTLCT